MTRALFSQSRTRLASACAAALATFAFAAPAFAWEPSKPVEFVVPAGTGGGADRWRAWCKASSSSTS